MRAITVYYWDEHDLPVCPKMLVEAFNLLREFSPAIVAPEHPVSKAFNRMVKNHEFTRADFTIVYDYAWLVSRMAEEKYTIEETTKDAPWGPAVVSACNNLRGVVVGIENMLKDCHR